MNCSKEGWCDGKRIVVRNMCRFARKRVSCHAFSWGNSTLNGQLEQPCVANCYIKVKYAPKINIYIRVIDCNDDEKAYLCKI